MPIHRSSEADAVDFAQRYGVRLSTARTALAVLPQTFSTDVPLWPDQSDAVRAYAAERGLSVHQALKALHADSNRTSAAAAASAVATFNRAHGIKTAEAPDRTRSTVVSADAAPRMQPAAKTVDAPVSSDPTAGATRSSACQAAADRIVALFKKSEGGSTHE